MITEYAPKLCKFRQIQRVLKTSGKSEVIFKESGEHEKQKHLVLTRNIGAQNSKLATIAIQAPDHDC